MNATIETPTPSATSTNQVRAESILLIEDDPGVSGFIRQGLREAGHDVTVIEDGHAGLKAATTQTFDVIVLDLMLPGRDGFSIIQELRRSGNHTPVICLTARDGVDDRVKGLNLGADDYLVKPFSFSELLARVHALSRRGGAAAIKPIVVGDLSIDVLTRKVQRGGKRIDLSAREYALLEYLGRAAGSVLTRTMILEHVWEMDQDPMTNVVDVHINRLRKKVDHGFARPLIQTIRGVGYALREE